MTTCYRNKSLRHGKLLIVVALLGLLPGQALAIDLEFYTWGGFEIMEDAFRRLGLIFTDNLFMRSAAAMAVLGIVMGFSVYYLRGLSGGQVDFRAVTIPMLAGVVLFNAFIIPTGTITVYDPTKNKVSIAPIPVPDGIVLIAGGLNMLQRVVRTVVDTGSAYPYEDEAGGITFELIYRATAEYTDVDDFYLTKSVGQYFGDCAPPALASGAYGPNLQDLKRNTTNLLNELGAMQSGSVFTTMYTAVNKDGVNVSCTDAWTIWLNPVLSDATTYDSALSGVCGKAGFNPGDAQQLLACRDLLGRALENYGVVGGDAVQFIRNVYLAQSIDRVMQKVDADLAQQSIASRNLMIQGVGMAQTANEWLPYVYAVIYALSLGMIPLLVLFLVTPLAPKAVLFTVGLFGWLTLWSISDMVTHQMAVDGATAFFLQAAQYNWGLDAIWLSPEASAKALAMFGKIRSMGVLVATVLAFGIYKWGGYALANMAEHFSGSIQNVGSEAAMRTNTPEGRAQLMREMEQAAAKHEQRSFQGFNDNVNAAVVGMGKSVSGGSQEHRALQRHGGGGPGNFADNVRDSGAIQAGSNMGGLKGMQQAAAYMNGVKPSEVTPEQMYSSSEKISALNASMQSMSAQAKYETLKQLGDGDFNKGASMYSVSKALSETSANQTQHELAESVQKNWQQATGERIGLPEAFMKVQQFREGSTFGDVAAYEGNPDKQHEYYETMKNYTEGEYSALKTTSEKYGLTPEQLGGFMGQYNTLNNIGQSKALENIPPSVFMAAAEYKTSQSAMDDAQKMQMTRYISALNGDSAFTTMNEKAQMTAAHDFGRLMTLQTIAQNSGMDVRTLAAKESGASVTIPISSESEFNRLAPMLRQSGLLSGTHEKMIATDGYTGTFNLSVDPINQQPLSMNYQSGSGVSLYNTVSDEESVRVSRDHHVDGSATAQLLNGKGAMLPLREKMKEAHRDLSDDGYLNSPEMRAFLDGANKLYAPFGVAHDTHSEWTQANGGLNLGINSSGGGGATGQGGRNPGRMSRIPVGAGVGYSGGEQDMEVQSSNTISTLYSKVVENALRFNRDDMLKEGSWGLPGGDRFEDELARRAAPMVQEFHEVIWGKFHHQSEESLASGNNLAQDAYKRWTEMEMKRMTPDQKERFQNPLGKDFMPNAL